MVASIICSAASDTPLPASPSRITSQTPLSAHRRNCRKIEFQLPNCSGRSRHGAPVRISQNTASSTRRWLRGGRPPPRWIRNGSKYAHSSSVISPRIKAASQRAALNQFAILASIGLSTRPSRGSCMCVQGTSARRLTVRENHHLPGNRILLRSLLARLRAISRGLQFLPAGQTVRGDAVL